MPAPQRAATRGRSCAPPQARHRTPRAASPTRAAGSLHDLRISVTDRCNFRCVYCMPKDVFDADYQFLPHAELLTFEEIARVARIFVGARRPQDPPDRRRAAAAPQRRAAGRDAGERSATSISR